MDQSGRATTTTTTMTTTPPHVAILPSPGMGHLIPLAEFAKRLVHCHGLTVTFITDGYPAASSFLASLPPAISTVTVPPPPLDDLPDGTKIETRICLSVARSLPAIRDVVAGLARTTRLAAFVADLFATDAFDVAREFGVSPYLFFPSTAMALSLFLHLPELDARTTCEYQDLPDLVRLPGCVPVHGRDLLDPVQDRKNEAYACLLHQCRRYSLADGMIVNTFEAIEGGAIKVLKEPAAGKPPVYPVGPLIQSGSSDPTGCLKWLDEQPAGSVLLVSFGSGGTLSWEQFMELAAGLEMSKQRFLWVVRSPSGGSADSAYFTVHSKDDPLAFLPQGFVERTKELGMVVPSWAPQVDVLRHEATGGFLTHCGWNSTLESMALGVPMVAWPLYAEQRMNAAMLEDAKVAIRPRVEEAGMGSGLVRREEVCRVVTALMEGDEGKKLRSSVKKLQEGAASALEEGGASCKALTEVANRWKKAAAAAATAGHA